MLPRFADKAAATSDLAPREVATETLKACAKDQQNAMAALVAAGTPQDVATKRLDGVRSRAMVR